MGSKSYGQFCPVARAAEVVTERWTPLVLRELLSGSHRFNDLRRGVPLMSPSLLSERLKHLEHAGVVERRRGAGERGWEYHLTPAGEELRPIVMGLGVWGQRWVRSDLSERELDAGLLMWDVRRRLDRDALPEERVVVYFRFRDAPSAKRYWWLVIDGDDTDLCLTDPGYETDLTVETDVRTLTGIWRGDQPLAEAVRSRRLVLEGPAELRRRFPSWLGLSVFARVERPEAAALSSSRRRG